MVLGILCVEPINPQYSGVLETCLTLRYWFFEVLGSESVKGKMLLVDQWGIAIQVQNNQFWGYIFRYTFGSEITFYDSVDTSQKIEDLT